MRRFAPRFRPRNGRRLDRSQGDWPASAIASPQWAKCLGFGLEYPRVEQGFSLELQGVPASSARACGAFGSPAMSPFLALRRSRGLRLVLALLFGLNVLAGVVLEADAAAARSFDAFLQRARCSDPETQSGASYDDGAAKPSDVSGGCPKCLFCATACLACACAPVGGWLEPGAHILPRPAGRIGGAESTRLIRPVPTRHLSDAASQAPPPGPRTHVQPSPERQS